MGAERSARSEVRDSEKSTEQLVAELAELKKRAEQLETSEAELRRLQGAILHAAQEWRTTFDAIGDLVCLLDREGRVRRCNKATAAFLRKPFDQILGQKLCELTFHPGQAPPDRPFLRMLGTRRAETSTLMLGKKWYRIMASPTFGDDGEITGCVHTMADVTDRHNLQQQLMQAEKLSTLGELIAGVAHELNNPLTAVVGFSQMLADRADCTVEVQHDLRSVYRNAQRCKAVVDNLLRFARQHKPERSVVSIHEVLDATVELLAYQFRVANVEIVREYGEGNPKVNADSNQLQQVFVNMMTNAVQAMRKAHKGGHLTIRTSCSGKAVRLEFADDGPGVTSENLPRVFDPFFTTKPTGKGTGLGLSVCFGIVTTHNGRIWAESEPGTGATFVIELPAAEQEDAGPQPRVTATQIMRLKQRVLVVDDEEVVCDILERMLTALGFRVITAGTGEQALAVLEESPADIIICDLRMPGFGGQGLYEAVTSRDPELGKRMIFCTGDTVSRDAREFLRRTGCRVVCKPFDLNRLEQTIAELQYEMAHGSATAGGAIDDDCGISA